MCAPACGQRHLCQHDLSLQGQVHGGGVHAVLGVGRGGRTGYPRDVHVGQGHQLCSGEGGGEEGGGGRQSKRMAVEKGVSLRGMMWMEGNEGGSRQSKGW